MSGAVSASVGEASVKRLSEYLFQQKAPSKLTAEQKDTISAITSLTAIAIGSTTGDVTDTVNAVETSKVIVEDNAELPIWQSLGK